MKKLYRSKRTRVIGGVAAGVAEYLDVDVTVMRLIFAAVGVIVPQAILAYILAWIIMPEEPGSVVVHSQTLPTAETSRQETANETTEEAGSQVPQATAPQKVGEKPKADRSRQIFGYALIAVGVTVFLRRIVPSFWWFLPVNLVMRWWPLLIIGLGLLIVFGSLKEGDK